LTEETWGEIDHTINYPHPTKSVALREQIRVLARATSTAGRLADAIFATLADENACGENVTLTVQTEQAVVIEPMLIGPSDGPEAQESGSDVKKLLSNKSKSTRMKRRSKPKKRKTKKKK
jgi:hypothetical protein